MTFREYRFGLHPVGLVVLLILIFLVSIKAFLFYHQAIRYTLSIVLLLLIVYTTLVLSLYLWYRIKISEIIVTDNKLIVSNYGKKKSIEIANINKIAMEMDGNEKMIGLILRDGKKIKLGRFYYNGAKSLAKFKIINLFRHEYKFIYSDGSYDLLSDEQCLLYEEIKKVYEKNNRSCISVDIN